MLDRVSEESEG